MYLVFLKPVGFDETKLCDMSQELFSMLKDNSTNSEILAVLALYGVSVCDFYSDTEKLMQLLLDNSYSETDYYILSDIIDVLYPCSVATLEMLNSIKSAVPFGEEESEDDAEETVDMDDEPFYPEDSSELDSDSENADDYSTFFDSIFSFEDVSESSDQDSDTVEDTSSVNFKYYPNMPLSAFLYSNLKSGQVISEKILLRYYDKQNISDAVTADVLVLQVSGNETVYKFI